MTTSTILRNALVLACVMLQTVLAYHVPFIIQTSSRIRNGKNTNNQQFSSTRLYNGNNKKKNKKPQERNGDNECHDAMLIRSALTLDTNNNNEWGIPLSSSLPPLSKSSATSAHSKGKKLPEELPNGGTVTLVGSGPGDPNLLTVAAYKLLTEADPDHSLIIIDRLVSKEIISLIPSNVPIKIARKLPGCADLAQEEIYWWIYQGLNSGKRIIRLKIGDPFVFGRGSEEILTIRQFAGIEAKVVPGVSAAFSAPLLGSIPVTHRGVANQVVMCTGYGREGSSPDLIQYHPEQTIVFLMAVGRLHDLCTKLQTLANYPADIPVAIVENAGCPNQRTVVGDITTIASLAQKYNVKPPSTIIVGNVVRVLLDHNFECSDYNDITNMIHPQNFENNML